VAAVTVTLRWSRCAVAGVLAGGLLVACTHRVGGPERARPVRPAPPPGNAAFVPQRALPVPEPAHPVNSDWQIGRGSAGGIAGYANRTSVAPGQPVGIYV
jgi:hypothetical protein